MEERRAEAEYIDHLGCALSIATHGCRNEGGYKSLGGASDVR